MRPRGGIIGASVTPTQSAASGVWTVREAEAYARSSAWPALPGAPTSVSGTAGNAQVALTWTAPSATGGSAITDYVVQYSSDSGSTWTTASRSASTAASATVTSLTNSTAYVFRVAAVTGYGTGAYSAASSSVTPAAPSFTATTVLLTSGTSYTVPSGATSMTAWAVGSGSGGESEPNWTGSSGGVAKKAYAVTGGATVTYAIGAGGIKNDPAATVKGNSTTVTYGGVTITGGGGQSKYYSTGLGGTYSGGDSGANGGNAVPGYNIAGPRAPDHGSLYSTIASAGGANPPDYGRGGTSCATYDGSGGSNGFAGVVVLAFT